METVSVAAADLKPGDQVTDPDGRSGYEVHSAELSQGRVQITDTAGTVRIAGKTDTFMVRRR